MSFPRYAEYKDSGVEWLGQVPASWHLKPLWSLFRRTKRDGFEDELLLSVYRDFGVVPKASRDDNFNKASDDLSAYQLVQVGDLAINKMKAWQGSVAISDFRGIVSPAYFVYQAEHQECARYLHYLMRSDRYIAAYMSLSKGIRVNQWDLEPAYHSRMAVLLPTSTEQAAIAAFLDRETGKIDALVAEQEKLIALLKEKRQAVISHAVTKGLNPDAPMKPSGIEWLGDVPAHWEVITLGRITTDKCDGPFGSGLKSEHYVEAGARVIRLQNIRGGYFDDRDTAFIDLAYFETKMTGHDVRGGDVLIAGLGDDKNTVGRACVAPAGIEPAMVKADCFRFRPDTRRAKPEFVTWALTMGSVFDAGTLSSGSTRSRIPLSDMASRKIALPVLDEQLDIARFVVRRNREFDSLTSEAERAITLLKERRSALISAAVTGQIDVRGLASLPAEAA